MAAESVQPVPWVWRASRRGPSSQSARPSCQSTSGERGPPRWPPLSRTAAAPNDASSAAASSIAATPAMGRDSRASASGMFGVMTVASGSRIRRSTPTASGFQQQITVAGHEDRVDDEGAETVIVDGCRHGLDDRRRTQHAGLDRGHPEVVDDGVDLGPHQRRRQHQRLVDADGVLGGHPGQGAGTPHAEGLEGLEVRLDTGAPTGIRAGNGECDRPGSAHDGGNPSSGSDSREQGGQHAVAGSRGRQVSVHAAASRAGTARRRVRAA